MKTSKPILCLIAASVSLAVLQASPAFSLCTSQGLDLMRSLNGPWRGKGAVTPIGGSPEFVSCKISYSMAGTDVISQVISCAGTDYKIEASSRVRCDGNRLEGSFEEKIGHSTGHVSGTISGNNLFIEADSPGFRGNFKVIFKSETDHLVAITQADYATGRQIPVASIKLTR
jgi:hypothetical protein